MGPLWLQPSELPTAAPRPAPGPGTQEALQKYVLHEVGHKWQFLYHQVESSGAKRLRERQLYSSLTQRNISDHIHSPNTSTQVYLLG